MYRKYFGLMRKPFELSPDSNTFFFGEMHKEVLAGLRQGLIEDRPLLLLTGGAGAGKTTLLNVLINSLEISGHLCVMPDPVMEVADFFAYLATQLGIRFNGNKAKFLVRFAQLLEKCRETDQKILVVIDEAHLLPIDILEELRLLAHLAAQVKKSVLSIFLAGAPELLCRLTREQLFLLNQRIAVRYHLGYLTREDCRRYILFRLGRAGARESGLFSSQAGELIYEATGGNPRQINLLCDNTLLAACSRGIPDIDAGLVRESVQRLHVQGGDSAFFLPSEQSSMQKWLAWTVMAVIAVEGAGMAYAYQKGWLDPVCRYVMKTIKPS